MKKIILLLMALLLCAMLVACTVSQKAQQAFLNSPEGKMIGKTFRDVEKAYGPFSMVFFESDEPPAFVFVKTNTVFFFDVPQSQEKWVASLPGGVGVVPAAVALKDMRLEDVCIGVSGRIKDFGIAESDVKEISKYIRSSEPAYYTTKTNKVYAVTSPDNLYNAFLYCRLDAEGVNGDDYIRVMIATGDAPIDALTVDALASTAVSTADAPTATPMADASTPAPAAAPTADPNVTEFSFGGATIRVGETAVEVRGTRAIQKTITAAEFQDLVLYCPDLTSLVLDYCDLTGEEQIGQLSELLKLELMTCRLTDVSFLKDLQKVTHLSLCHNDLSDISAAEHLPLAYLNIADNQDLGEKGVRSAAKITSLQELYLYDLKIQTLAPLKSLNHLRRLNINHDSKITEKEISQLSNLKLRKLQITGTGVKSLDFLADDFPALRELEARKLKQLKKPSESFMKLTNHPNLKTVTLGKDIRDTLDADVQKACGKDAVTWFGDHGIALSFR